MLRRPTIPDTAFPSTLDPDNAIRSFYKTNLLYPAAGPAAVSGYIMRMAGVIRQLTIADSVINNLRAYRRKYDEVPVVQPQEFVLDPRIRNASAYVEGFIAKVRQHPLLESTGQIALDVREAVGLAPASTERAGMMRMSRSVAAPLVAGGRGRSLGSTTDVRRSLDTAMLMRAFAVPNVVFGDMFAAGMLKADGPIVANTALFAEREKPHKVIVAALARRVPTGLTERAVTATLPLVRLALRRVARHRGTELLDSFESSPAFRNALGRYLIGTFGHFVDYAHPNWPSPGGITFPGDDVDAQREWAFQRYEELRLALATPILRGPVVATPVAPRSRHAETQTESTTTRDIETSSASRTSRTSESHRVISASTFSQALDNLSESGIADASSFEQESTLLSTLREERRAVIDTVAREISAGVESGRTSLTESTLGRSREYWTEGKDPKLSTTELAFQVVVPTLATVLLRDIGLAWCPRVALPFSPLRENVRNHQLEQELAYNTQYYVPLPIGPAIVTELAREEYFEFWIRGRKNVNKKNFSRTFSLYGDSKIDLNDITVKHRNGEWDDAEEFPGMGSIPYNYDDLEHAMPYLENLTLSEDGATLSGTGVLETHDPEYLNVSWLGITVPIKKYTAETVAALAAFEAAKTESDLKLQAVKSRAKQYAKMKADELIDQYSRTIDVQREAFRALIRRICLDVPPPQHSYFEEVLSRCVNWNEAAMKLESEDMVDLSYRDLPPDHFMNAPAARFFLPIQKGAEELFFGTLRKTGHDYYEDSVEQIREQLTAYRDQIETWTEAEADELKLDEFTSEIVIGHHLEAVVSESEFANGP